MAVVSRQLTPDLLNAVAWHLIERHAQNWADIGRMMDEYVAAHLPQWQPIESAPRDGRTLLLGYHNRSGNWRTLRGRWVGQEEIDDWEGDDEFLPGWYEDPVEGEHCYPTAPTHWMPLPKGPGLSAGSP